MSHLPAVVKPHQNRWLEGGVRERDGAGVEWEGGKRMWGNSICWGRNRKGEVEEILSFGFSFHWASSSQTHSFCVTITRPSAEMGPSISPLGQVCCRTSSGEGHRKGVCSPVGWICCRICSGNWYRFIRVGSC